MTLVARMQDNLSAGTAITGSGTTHANLAGMSTYNVASPSTLVWATDSGAGTGQTVLHYSVSTGTDITRWNLNATNDFVAVSILVKVPASAPSGNNVVMTLRSTNATPNAMRFGFNSSNRPFVSDSASSLFFIANAGVLTANTWYRFEFLVHGNSASTGTCGVNVYTPSGSSPISGASQSFTGMNLTASPMAAVEIGNSAGNQPIDFYAANLQYDDGRTTEIGALATQLATPSVTLGTTTNPTTVGGTNGSQVVSWGAVSNATAYDAYLATNTSPAQGDFSLVASNVTSPYTFTGLAAGGYAFGIKAKP